MNQNCNCHKNNNQQAYSRTVRDYLNTFHCILEQMIEGMTTARLSDSISQNFIVQMIPHHRAAIEMSQNILCYTNNTTIEQIANQIIREQTKSIANMEAALPTCRALTNSQNCLCQYRQQVNPVFQTMFHKMQNAQSSNSVDCNFLWEMLPHHEGAVSFAEITLCYDICPQLRPILQAIITSQKRGICQMQQLLQTLSC